jgi:1-acyl-sn-glycerol-3-phosphate acyltransferase
MKVVRSALFNLFFFLSTFLLVFPGTVVRLIAPERVLGYASAWARLELAALRIICGIGFEVTGREHLPSGGPALIASRHQSAFDTLVWMILVPRCCYVLKRELLKIPLFGPMVSAARMIALDREAGASALRALVKQGEEAALAGRQIVIFPEGTRADPGAPLPLQPGVAALAAHLGLAVVPVATDSGLFWGRRAFRKNPGKICIAIQPPIPPGLPRRELMRRLDAVLRDEAELGTDECAAASGLSR